MYFWSANHIALHVKTTQYNYSHGNFEIKIDDEHKPLRMDKFRALTHESDYIEECSNPYTPKTIKDVINDLFDNEKKKKPSLIKDFWEDCSLYIREDQIEMLKALYELVITHYALDDDEDFEDQYDDDEVIEESIKSILEDKRNGAERRHDALIASEQFEPLKALLTKLKQETSPLKKKYILINFIEEIKKNKGLSLNLSSDADEDTMFGKLPIQTWELPLGNSLLDNDNHSFGDNLNLFGIHAKGVDNGIKKFDDPDALVHHQSKNSYYKFFSRYHNCSGYSRFLLEQGGITAFSSTNQLEHFGITDPQKYNDYLMKVSAILNKINNKSREIIIRAKVKPIPLKDLTINYLANFKKGESNYNSLPTKVRKLIDQYNKELVDVSYEYKIQILMKLVNTIHSSPVNNTAVVDALQKEVRRNYEINFDAQFSHNHYFQLQVLAACSAITVAACAIGILAIAFPPLIPITLAAAVVITATAAVTSAVSISLFATKSKPQRPSIQSLVQTESIDKKDRNTDTQEPTHFVTSPQKNA